MIKRLTIVRHGQAAHNVRAEVAKAAGCSMEEFVRLMRLDDVLDAPLTDLGKKQAAEAAVPTQNHGLIVASPLSRALETADILVPPHPDAPAARRVCELFREVNGDLLNAKRRTVTELRGSFPYWSFEEMMNGSDEDDSWTPNAMEPLEDAAERGYLGLCWLLHQPEQDILLVGHGGVLRYMMQIHPLVRVEDGRLDGKGDDEGKPADERFDNCERRQYTLSWGEESEEVDGRRPVILTQVN